MLACTPWALGGAALSEVSGQAWRPPHYLAEEGLGFVGGLGWLPHRPSCAEGRDPAECSSRLPSGRERLTAVASVSDPTQALTGFTPAGRPQVLAILGLNPEQGQLGAPGPSGQALPPPLELLEGMVGPEPPKEGLGQGRPCVAGTGAGSGLKGLGRGQCGGQGLRMGGPTWCKCLPPPQLLTCLAKGS